MCEFIDSPTQKIDIFGWKSVPFYWKYLQMWLFLERQVCILLFHIISRKKYDHVHST